MALTHQTHNRKLDYENKKDVFLNKETHHEL